MEKSIVGFKYAKEIEEKIIILKELLEKIDINSKDLSFKNINKLKEQKENLLMIECIGHEIRNYSQLNIVSPMGERLTII